MDRRSVLEPWIRDFRQVIRFGAAIIVAAAVSGVAGSILSVFVVSTRDRSNGSPSVVGMILGVLVAFTWLESHIPEDWSVAVRRGVQTGAVASVFTPGGFYLLWGGDGLGDDLGIVLFVAFTFAAALVVNVGMSYALKLPRLRKVRGADRVAPSPRGGERREWPQAVAASKDPESERDRG